MKCAALLLPLLAFASPTSAQESILRPQIDSVGLFKNGLCVVKCSFTADRAGDFIWDEPPRAVHGTFLVESEGAVAIRSTLRKLDDPDETQLPTGNLQTDLAGAEVRLTLLPEEGKAGAVVTGKVWTMPQAKPKPRVWSSQDGAGGDAFANARMYNAAAAQAAPTTGGFLVLEGARGPQEFVALGRIGRVEIVNPGAVKKQSVDKPAMILSITKPGPVKFSYLTRGASWVPSYFIDLNDGKNLRIRQTAVIKNELMPLKEVEMALISGFPNVEFGQVDSPLWLGSTLASFFQQIGARPGLGAASMLNQQVLYNRATEAGTNSPLPTINEPGATTQDLHFESIGKRTLQPGDALVLDVAASEAPYERVVEWTIQDKRDAFGQYISSGRGQPEESQDTWDSVLFQNPLKFPMTTASATIREGGQFRGQSQSNWTNPGQRTCLHITKALSLQADHTEIEESGKRENEVWIGGRRYYRATVKAEARVRNFRSSAVTLLMKAQFSGSLLETEERPADTLRREGVFSVNPRHELEWKLSLPADSEKKVMYRYTVLVSS